MGNLVSNSISYEDGAYINHDCFMKGYNECKVVNRGGFRDFNCMLDLVDQCKLSGDQVKALVDKHSANNKITEPVITTTAPTQTIEGFSQLIDNKVLILIALILVFVFIYKL